MLIQLESIRDFHQKNVYFRSLIPYDSMVATLVAVDRCNLSMKVISIGHALITCKVPSIAEPNMAETIRLAMRNMGSKWILVSEYGENPANNDRTTCFKCGCHTEMQRDFHNFTVRLLCPRCHI